MSIDADTRRTTADPLSRSSRSGHPRVVIAHDYLTQRGGAERVVLALSRAFPGSRVVTSVYNPETTYPEFADIEIETSWLNRVPAFREDPRRALALLPPAWRSLTVTDADVVVCSSTGWSHGVRSTAPKVVYCHNPARWLYQTDEYLMGGSPVVTGALRALAPALRRWDRRAAGEVDTWIANSTVVAERIHRTYGAEADVVFPPSSVDATGPLEPVVGLEPGFLLTVGRVRGYKNTGAIAEAVSSLPTERLVCVGGTPPGDWGPRVFGLSGVTDPQLRWLYANAAALVACSFEDFGLTPVEAYSFGTPALVLRAGGYLDSARPGVTGAFIERPDASSVRDAIVTLRGGHFEPVAIRAHAEQFSEEAFAERLRAEVEAAVVRPAPLRLVGAAPEVAPATAQPARSPRYAVGLAEVDDAGPDEVLGRVMALARETRGHRATVVTPNLAHLDQLRRDDRLRRAYRGAALVIADGWPVVLAMRIAGASLRSRVTGSDLVPRVVAAAAAEGLSVGLVGGSAGSVHVAAERLRAQLPDLDLSLVDEPPMGLIHDAAAVDALCETVAAADPQILLLGLGAPQQEYLSAEQQDRLGAGVTLCVGASIDFLSGSQRRAPRVVQRAGLEWLWRVLGDPRRLASRYARCLPTMVSVLAEATQRRASTWLRSGRGAGSR